MWKKKADLEEHRKGTGEMSFTDTKTFVEMGKKKKKKPEAELGGFEGLQMQPAETSANI